MGELSYTGLPAAEVERRYRLVREAAARDGLDAVIVCGNEYTGFEGAVAYLSGFVIVHRYAYVLLPVDGEPAIVFPSEARYVGEHGTTWIEEQVFVDRPGEWLADRVEGNLLAAKQEVDKLALLLPAGRGSRAAIRDAVTHVSRFARDSPLDATPPPSPPRRPRAGGDTPPTRAAPGHTVGRSVSRSWRRP